MNPWGGSGWPAGGGCWCIAGPFMAAGGEAQQEHVALSFAPPWSANSSSTSRSSSKKSISSTYVFFSTIILISPPAVEAGCESARNQGHAAVPHPGPRGLPQVRTHLFSSARAHSPQVQQALRLPALLRAPRLAAPRAGSLPRAHGGPAALQALRHGRPQRRRQALRRREQAHRRRLLPPPPRRLHVHVQDGRVRQRRACHHCHHPKKSP